MSTIINLIAFTIFIILILPALTVMMKMVLGSTKKIIKSSNELINDYGIIITAYKNFAITIPSIESFIKQKYPKSKYHVYVAADDCYDVEEINSNNVSVLEPTLSLSSKVKSISYAMNSFIRKHDYIIVMDADNVVVSDYLSTMNKYTQKYLAVQGKRTHKNLDTIYSCLDAGGEIYYNYIQRNVPFTLGSSAAISGSGMAVSYEVFDKFIKTIQNEDKVIVAEDKLLQNYLVGQNIQIAFSEDALIYDEKISKGYQAQRQRTRWLNSYFQNLKEAAGIILQGVKRINFNQIFFGVMTSYPPIITMIAVSFFVSLLAIFFNISGMIIIGLGWLIFTANFILVLLLKKARKEIWKSLLYIPLFASRQIMALLNMKKANKDFMATEHTKVIPLNEVLKGN